MKTQVQKWGNSLAVRIPKAFADEVGLAAESIIELTVTDGQLTLTPVKPYTLNDLLAQVTDENLHNEIDFGQPVGDETW